MMKLLSVVRKLRLSSIDRFFRLGNTGRRDNAWQQSSKEMRSVKFCRMWPNVPHPAMTIGRASIKYWWSRISDSSVRVVTLVKPQMTAAMPFTGVGSFPLFEPYRAYLPKGFLVLNPLNSRGSGLKSAIRTGNKDKVRTRLAIPGHLEKENMRQVKKNDQKRLVLRQGFEILDQHLTVAKLDLLISLIHRDFKKDATDRVEVLADIFR